MAYQFFANAHQTNRSSSASPPLSPPQHSSPLSSNNAHVRPPKYPPPKAFPPSSAPSPQSISLAAKFKPPPTKDAPLQPPAYPPVISPGYSTPHPHVTIDPVNTAHIPSLTRITGLLLPIRYPNSFYTATITDPVIASLSRVAIYHDHPVAAAPGSGASTSPPTASPTTTGTDKVIGGIRCRLERLPPTTPEHSQNQRQPHQEPVNLYIQTLHLLSPYRGCGIAASLLNSLLFSTPPPTPSSLSSERPAYQVSELVKHYNIRTVTAHVHEANEEGLKWYISRGFQVEDRIVENYYRRLKPSGAKIVRLALQWSHIENNQVVENHNDQSPQRLSEDAKKDLEDDDDDWEKVEAEDENDQDDHGIESFTDSRLIDIEDPGSRKRKADEEPQRL